MYPKIHIILNYIYIICISYIIYSFFDFSNKYWNNKDYKVIGRCCEVYYYITFGLCYSLKIVWVVLFLKDGWYANDLFLILLIEALFRFPALLNTAPAFPLVNRETNMLKNLFEINIFFWLLYNRCRLYDTRWDNSSFQ